MLQNGMHATGISRTLDIQITNWLWYEAFYSKNSAIITFWHVKAN